jgi:4-hydroxybenzoate polyprenyltransferase
MTQRQAAGSGQRAATDGLFDRLAIFARDIKITHTIFAMPFALLSMTLAAGQRAAGLRIGHVVLIVLCMICARSVAMAVNRLFDARLDALNPRTAKRAIPSGALSSTFVAGVASFFAACFIATTVGFQLLYENPWPLILSVPVLLFLSAYPLLKRFTQLCHYYLGAALALAPVCAWIAVAGRLDPEPLWMAAAVVCWTAGFDIIYACQDYDADVRHGVFSIPSRFGIAGALWISRATHAACIGMLIALGLASPALGTLYYIGVAIAAALLTVEQSLVSPRDLSKVGLAFFTINGIISLLLGVLGIIDSLI